MSELIDIAERIRAAEDVLKRIEVRAPLHGTIVDLQVHTPGGVVNPGERLMDIVPSGDRLVIDAQVNPNDIDIDRANADDHIAFGQGIHFCPGALLARKEMNVAFTALLQRLENFSIDEEKSDLTYWPNIVLRGMKELHVRFDKRTGG